ncbi:helix-turn-helix transcriptional regulator [Brachyspira pilosicoli]|uniref:helix-turn-helix domain-containing protein n=1 Tax=Brachyspira pilosicoli TaxID=52584 RepID=UPI0030076E77
MKLFSNLEKEFLEDKELQYLYKIDRVLESLSTKITNKRIELKLTQKELADKSGITQQQLSKIELAENCNIKTFIKVLIALDLDIDLIKKSNI